MNLGETLGILHATFETGNLQADCSYYKQVSLLRILLLIFDMSLTGENFTIKLSGTTYTVSVELEKQVVRFQDTYNTMIRQQTFKITNKSNHLLTYMCMKNDCVFYGMICQSTQINLLTYVKLPEFPIKLVFQLIAYK